MAQFSCIVEVVGQENCQWETIPPGGYDVAEGRGEYPLSAKNGTETNASDAEQTQEPGSRSKVAGASSLRHEVRFD
jgi:hypothetical protein